MATKPSKTTKATKPKLVAVANDDTVITPAAPAMPDVVDMVDDSDLDSAVSKADSYKMKELLTAVVTKTGAKKKDAKDVVDAVLAEIASALQAGKSLSLPPLGNLRVAKTMEKGGASMMVLRLRLASGEAKGKGGKEALAEDGEDS